MLFYSRRCLTNKSLRQTKCKERVKRPNITFGDPPVFVHFHRKKNWTLQRSGERGAQRSEADGSVLCWLATAHRRRYTRRRCTSFAVCHGGVLFLAQFLTISYCERIALDPKRNFAAPRDTRDDFLSHWRRSVAEPRFRSSLRNSRARSTRGRPPTFQKWVNELAGQKLFNVVGGKGGKYSFLCLPSIWSWRKTFFGQRFCKCLRFAKTSGRVCFDTTETCHEERLTFFTRCTSSR